MITSAGSPAGSATCCIPNASVEPEFDLRRLRELEASLDADLPAIITMLLAELTRALEQLRAAISAGDWPSAEQAAHAGRNSALMLDAGTLLGVLGEAERAARRADLPTARAAQDRLALVWPALRARLEAEARDRT